MIGICFYHRNTWREKGGLGCVIQSSLDHWSRLCGWLSSIEKDNWRSCWGTRVTYREAEKLGLWASWIKTKKVQEFSEILDVTIESIPVNGENMEVTQMFTYLGRVIHSPASCELEVSWWMGWTWRKMNSLEECVWHCHYFCKKMKVQVYCSLVLPVLLYSCETWTLTGELNQSMRFFGTMELCWILG